jgi:hypothetical protein
MTSSLKFYSGGGDCPELALKGIQNALEHALSNSIAFVFTDASAKDFELFDTILPVIQEKQVTINFIITEGCSDDPTEPGFEVYQKIADASEGQLFRLSKDGVKEILLALTKTLEPDYVTLASISFDKAGESDTPIAVDSTFSELSVSLSGDDSSLSIRDDADEEVETRPGFTSKNAKFLSFSVSKPKYRILAKAGSAYSIRVGGKSDLQIDFGFSRSKPNSLKDTTYQPLPGRNVLSIFVSNRSLIKCITRAFLISTDDNDWFEIKVLLKWHKKDIVLSEPMDLPSKMFKIKVVGYDASGKLIERIISSGIQTKTA